MDNKQFHKFIIITMMLPSTHASSVRLPLLDRALVEFAQAGFIAGAAGRPYRTPSR
jgi:hypothetical protein